MAARKKKKKKKTKKTVTKRSPASSSEPSVTGRPAFPYSTTPNSLRRFLEQVPQKPRPEKVNRTALKSWGLRNTNDQTIIRVLKALGLVASSGEPTEQYTQFMRKDVGPSVLATEIRRAYASLFEHSLEPHKEPQDSLRNLFNIHSGGGERSLHLQIQTFKSLCDFADFSSATPAGSGNNDGKKGEDTPEGADSTQPTIHIDLHIHLPENKSRRDYEYIFEDIGRYLLGRQNAGDRGK